MKSCFEKKCKKCGTQTRGFSEKCRKCGINETMTKRSENLKWRENLSKALKGKLKSDEHKKALKKAFLTRKVVPRKKALFEDRGNSWSVNRRLALERDAKRCRHCGSREKIEVHHMISLKKTQNNDLSNLITLCVRCHRNAEEIRKPSQRMKNHRGVLLAGGRGTRLSPNTLFHNKHELPVGYVPMIFYPLLVLRKLGITKILVVLDRSRVGRIIEMLGSGKEFGVDITYAVQEGAGGIAEALLLAKDFVGKNNFTVILGDNIFDVNEFNSKTLNFYSRGCVFLKEVENPKNYGVAEFNKKKDRVVGIEEKPEKPKTNFAVTGLYSYKGDVFSILDELKPSDRDELEISGLNDYLAKKNELSYKFIKSDWLDAGGSIEGYVDANLKSLGKLNE